MGRLIFWGIAVNFFLGSPLYGVGIGNFQNLYGQYISVPWISSDLYGVHNLYLQLLSETGLLGLGTFFGVLIAAIHAARSQWRHSTDLLGRALGFGILGAIAAMLVHGFVDFVMEASPQFGTLLWLCLGLMIANGRISAEPVRPAFSAQFKPRIAN